MANTLFDWIDIINLSPKEHLFFDKISDIKDINKKILKQQYRTNQQLIGLNNQMALLSQQMNELTYTNRELLAVNIREEKNRIKQAFYKEISFHYYEIIDLISEIKDKAVQIYVIKKI